MNNKFKKSSIITRNYNNIIFKNNRVIKGVPKDRYLKEIKWFSEAKKVIPLNIPLIYLSKNEPVVNSNKIELAYYEMQAINGNNLYQWSIDNKNEAEKIFDNVISLVMLMHKESFEVKNDDIIMMYYLKPKIAIENFIKEKKLNPNSLKINGIFVQNPIVTLDKVFNQFKEKLLNTRYSFIHGDLTMSNILVGQDQRLYLIDPRGVFGNTNFYGDVRYDVAKLLYSIVGNFDSLNNGRFEYEYNIEKKEHLFSISNNGFSLYGERILYLFKEDEYIIKYIHATIWLSLVSHISENEKQQLCAFCNGIFLLDIFKKYGNE